MTRRGSDSDEERKINPQKPQAPPQWGRSEANADYCLRRREAASPARPRPRRATVAGSGTAVMARGSA